MKIYVGHSRDFDYQNGLYDPLRRSRLNSMHEIILPHERSDKPYSSKEFFKICDVMIAEVSYPATGLGIELGWADASGVPVICIHRKGCKPSRSLTTITDKFVEYTDEKDMIDGIEKQLSTIQIVRNPS